MNNYIINKTLNDYQYHEFFITRTIFEIINNINIILNGFLKSFDDYLYYFKLLDINFIEQETIEMCKEIINTISNNEKINIMKNLILIKLNLELIKKYHINELLNENEDSLYSLQNISNNFSLNENFNDNINYFNLISNIYIFSNINVNIDQYIYNKIDDFLKTEKMIKDIYIIFPLSNPSEFIKKINIIKLNYFNNIKNNYLK